MANDFYSKGNFVRQTLARAEAVNTELQQIEEGFDAVQLAMESGGSPETNLFVRKDGSTPIAADMPWGGYKITNLGDATADTDAVNRRTGDSRWLIATVMLNAIKSITPAVDKMIYFTSATTAALTDLGAQARTFLSATTQAAQRAVLGVTETGADTTYNKRASNLSDVENVVTARANLGVPNPGSDTAYNLRANNLSDVLNPATARANLGITDTGGTGDTTYNWRANNLSDVGSVATARSNLGVTATGADPAYNVKSANLADVPDKAAARANLGISEGGGSSDATYNWRANNLSDVANVGTARNNLGLGSMAQQAAGAVAISGGTASGLTITTSTFTGGSITGAAITGGTIVSLSTDLAIADGGTGASTAAAARANLGIPDVALYPEATIAEIRAVTPDKMLVTDTVYAAAALVSLTDAASIALDFNTGINFIVTLAGNRALANPTNPVVGKSGVIIVRQDGTGSRTLSFGTSYEFAGTTPPTLTTTPLAKDVFSYFIESSTSIILSPLKAVA